MSLIENYPLGPLVAALQTLAGRIVLVFTAVVLGAMLGGLTATRDISGAWWAVEMFPFLAIASLLSGIGLLVFPLAFLLGVFFIRREWPLWVVGVVTVLIWWNAHRSIIRGENRRSWVEAHVDAAMDEAEEARRHRERQEPADR